MRESKMPSQNYTSLQELGGKRSDAFIASTPIRKACSSSSSSSSSVMIGMMLPSLSKITLERRHTQHHYCVGVH